MHLFITHPAFAFNAAALYAHCVLCVRVCKGVDRGNRYAVISESEMSMKYRHNMHGSAFPPHSVTVILRILQEPEPHYEVCMQAKFFAIQEPIHAFRHN